MLQSSIAMIEKMIHTVLLAIWFFLPAGVANAAPILAARLPLLRRLNSPMDFGLSWKGARLLGSHKTWRGFIIGVLLATVTFWFEQRLVVQNAFFAYIANDTWTLTLLPVWALGPLLGLGALLGVAVKSFFKRRSGVAPGESWFPYDQIDFILGAMALSALSVAAPLAVYVAALVVWTLIQLGAQYTGHWLGIKERPL